MNDLTGIISLVAAVVTIVATTVSIILWAKYRERDKWVTATLKSIYEGIDRALIFSRLPKQDAGVGDRESLSRVGDMLATVEDNIVEAVDLVSGSEATILRIGKMNPDEMREYAGRIGVTAGELSPDTYGKFVEAMNRGEYNTKRAQKSHTSHSKQPKRDWKKRKR